MTDNYVDELPPRDELWEVVQEAHDYLNTWVSDPDSRTDPDYGAVGFSVYNWGTSTWGECEVCLAGLYYLRKYGTLLGQDYQCRPDLAEFLDNLTYRGSVDAYIEQLLGVCVPDRLRNDLVGRQWTGDNPSHLLAFLQWLLGQRTPGGINNE